VGYVALHDPLETVADSDDFDVLENGTDRGRRDDTVDSGGGTASDEDREMLVRANGRYSP
jgi:hypothetical protein